MYCLAKYNLIRYNGKVLFRKEYMAGLIYGFLLFAVLNFRLLTQNQVAVICETYISLFGIIFLTSIVELDFQAGMIELIATKKVGRGVTFGIRFLLVIIVLGIITGSIQAYMLLKGSDFLISQFFFGTMVSEVFLGLIGITVANLTKNVILGYFAGISYFLFEYLTRGHLTKKLYLFSLIRGDLESKYYLLIVIIFLICVNLLLLQRRKTNYYD